MESRRGFIQLIWTKKLSSLTTFTVETLYHMLWKSIL